MRTMTYLNPDNYQPEGGPPHPDLSAPQQYSTTTSEDLGWAMTAMLALFGITARQDRLAASTQKAMKVVMIGGLAVLVAFGAFVAFVYIAHR